jgi:hypothetical protein
LVRSHQTWARDVPRSALPPDELRLRPTARRLGYTDVAAYLRGEHLERHRTVAALAIEAEVSAWTIATALRRNGIQPIPHTTKRSTAAHRSSTTAQALGFDSLSSYIRHRRTCGFTWKALARESGLPETTIRRHGRRLPWR